MVCQIYKTKYNMKRKKGLKYIWKTNDLNPEQKLIKTAGV